MTVDFEKCFDHIEYLAILGSLRYFGFQENFLKWVNILITDFQLCTQNNGECSECFEPTRAMKQGCCLSPFLLLCCGEVMTHLIKSNPKLVGLEIYDLIALLAQFADDTILFLDFQEATFQAVIDTFEILESNTGLNVIYDKTSLCRMVH